jgi:molybdopterin-guanine dinucleotide biosynthesis protein A
VSVRYVEKDEIDRFDPEHLSFFNINTKADLEKARLLASRDIIPGTMPITDTGNNRKAV